MRMNSNTILAGRGVNALAALDAGNRARAFQEDAQFQNALRPMQMESAQLGVQQQRQALELGQEQIANIRRQASAAAAAAEDKATLAREYEQAQNGMKMALTALTTGDQQAWNQVAAGFGMSGLPMDESGARALDAVLSGIGEGLGLGAAIPETPEPTADMRNLQWRAEQAGLVPGSPEYRDFMSTGGRQPMVQVNTGNNFAQPVTPGQEKVDEAFAQTYLDWTQGGGADMASQIARIDAVASQLEGGANLTGPVVGNVPDIIGTVTNPDAVQAREQVEEVVQRNLRLILGAQFTEKEGERLISRAYNPRLPPKKNAERLRRLSKAMKAAAEARNSQMRYFQENGTLTGWQGEEWTVGDFYEAIEGPITGGDVTPGRDSVSFDPPPAAVQLLRDDPSLEAQREFDEAFGEGAAARALRR